MDLDFLDVELPRLARRRTLVNVFDVVGLSGSERAADQTLAYFFDPGERHGMGSTFVDAFLSLLSGQAVLGDAGLLHDAPFAEGPFLGSSEWTVGSQVPVAAPQIPHGELGSPGIMDLYLTNDALGIAVVIENKIDAPLDNPLETYARHAVEGYSTVLLAVLAPYQHALSDEQARWVSRVITYQALFERLREMTEFTDHLADDSSIDVRRSLELLDQFQEVRERSANTVDYASEAQFVNAFRQQLSGREGAVDEFFNAVTQVNRLFRERSRRLEPLIRERLEVAEVETGWEAHGENNQRWVYAWNAYQLGDSGNSIELIMTPDPGLPGPITVKAYPGRTNRPYPDFDHITFGVDWQSSDEEVADAFLGVLARLLQDHPRGS